MKGKNRGPMILKNGGEFGNVGGNLISKMIEFSFLDIYISSEVENMMKGGHIVLGLHIFGDRE